MCNIVRSNCKLNCTLWCSLSEYAKPIFNTLACARTLLVLLHLRSGGAKVNFVCCPSCAVLLQRSNQKANSILQIFIHRWHLRDVLVIWLCWPLSQSETGRRRLPPFVRNRFGSIPWLAAGSARTAHSCDVMSCSPSYYWRFQHAEFTFTKLQSACRCDF